MAERRIEVPAYGPDAHLMFDWDDGFQILVDRTNSEVTIRANAAGLVSLARHCLTLAQESVPPGSHIHLTDSVELEAGSGDLIIDRMTD
ncbi:Imm32 family immunity protein [Rhizomonospora bruguierae]